MAKPGSKSYENTRWDEKKLGRVEPGVALPVRPVEISTAAMELFTDLRAFFQMMADKADTPLEKQFVGHIRKNFADLAASPGTPSPQPREVGGNE